MLNPSTEAGDAPLVTIVTPTLNRREMLEPTLRSVRSQTYGRIEHIVVDGGSTDGTLEMLRAYERTYPMRWISEPDSGMYSAINKGLRMGTGEIQAYVNSDDLYFPWSVQVAVDEFLAHRDADVVYGDVLEITEGTGAPRLAFNVPFAIDYFRRWGLMWQPAVFWRRAAMDDISGFDESIRFGADLECWLRLAARGRQFHHVHEFLAVVRMHPETLSLVHRTKVIAELDEIRAKHAPPAGRPGAWLKRFDRLRRPFWRAVYWAGLILQSIVPKRVRGGPWSRFLGDGRTRISYLAAALRPIPWIGRRRLAGPILRLSRNWLQPPE